MSLVTSIDLRPVSSSGRMWSGVAASGLLHVAIAAFLIVGVPEIFRPDPPQMVVPIDIVNLDELSELASLPAEQVGPVETAEESEPVERVDEVARPQQATPQPALQPSPPTPTEAAIEPTPQPEAEQAPVPEAREPEPTPAEPTPPEPAPAETAEPVPSPAEPAEAPPQVAAVPPADATPSTPVPEATEARETPPPAPQPAEPAAEPAEPAEEQPLMTGVLPLPTPPRPPDARPAEPQPQQAQATPPPSPVRAEEPEETVPEDPLAGVLRNIDQNLRPAVEEPQQQAARPTGQVTQSLDLTRRAAALGQMIRGQMQRCWRIDPGAQSAERLRVTVRVRLRPDGTLMSPPEFQNVAGLANSPYYRAAAESARRAILECQPFQLPQEDYELWQDLVLNFDPREMF